MAAAAGPELTIIVPGLFGPVPPAGVSRRAARQSLADGLALDAMESLLSRARRTPLGHAYDGPEDLCFGVLGYQRAPGSDWPVAAVTRHADVGDGSRRWYLRADPVHLRADMTDLVLFDGEHFDLGLEEARALAGVVAAHSGPGDWQFEVPHPLRWYLALDSPPEIRTAPLSVAKLQPVKPHLPAGADGAKWCARMNEIQMLLHHCEVNQARERRGELAINSLWFWGGGVLPGSAPATFSRMVADSPLATGLGALAEIPSSPLPEDGARRILDGFPGGAMVVVMDEAYGAARSGNVDTWRRLVTGLERNWFAPLKRALDSGGLASLNVVCDRSTRFELRAARWWRRLRRPRSFAELAESCDEHAA